LGDPGGTPSEIAITATFAGMTGGAASTTMAPVMMMLLSVDVFLTL